MMVNSFKKSLALKAAVALLTGLNSHFHDRL